MHDCASCNPAANPRDLLFRAFVPKSSLKSRVDRVYNLPLTLSRVLPPDAVNVF